MLRFICSYFLSLLSSKKMPNILWLKLLKCKDFPFLTFSPAYSDRFVASAFSTIECLSEKKKAVASCQVDPAWEENQRGKHVGELLIIKTKHQLLVLFFQNKKVQNSAFKHKMSFTNTATATEVFFKVA